MKYIVTSSDSTYTLISVITRSSVEDLSRVFAAIVQLWLESTAFQLHRAADIAELTNAIDALAGASFCPSPTVPVIEIEQTPFEQEKSALFLRAFGSKSALFDVIKFTKQCVLADEGSAKRRAILDAGILALVLSTFACKDYRLDSLFKKGQNARKQNLKDATGLPRPPLGIALINAEASTLSVLVHKPKFERNWQEDDFGRRKIACASLVSSLFSEDEQDPQYAVTEALFVGIVASSRVL